jgi:hypothetical protein
MLGLNAPALAETHAPPGWSVWNDPGLGYSIAYPPGWRLDPHYTYAGFGPDHPIEGVAFEIPAAMADGTNLSNYLTNVSVESMPGGGPCDAAHYLADPQNLHTLVEDGRRWSVAQSADAGAGNRYDIRVFVLEGRRPCLAVRYFIHSTGIGNYAPGAVRRFDLHALLARFDAVRRTLTVTEPSRQK